MKAARMRERLQRRQRVWMSSGLGRLPGFKMPGSFKKPFPEGKSTRESRRKSSEAARRNS